MEISSLPVGPIEVSTIWFARARLAYSTLVVKFWSAATEGKEPINEMHTYVGRTMEKTSKYPLAVLKDVLQKRPDLAAFNQLTLWSDGCGQFKSREVVGTTAFDFAHAFGWEEVETSYTAPKHGKSPLDGHMGVLSKVKESVALRKMLLEICDVVDAFRAYFDREAIIHPTQPKHVVTEFIPAEKRFEDHVVHVCNDGQHSLRLVLAQPLERQAAHKDRVARQRRHQISHADRFELPRLPPHVRHGPQCAPRDRLERSR